MRRLTSEEVKECSGANIFPYLFYAIATNQTISFTDYILFDAAYDLIEALLGGG